MTEHTEDTKPSATQSCDNLFCSADFIKFLSNDLPSSSSFLSKDDSLPSFDVPSIFKSKDTFSQMYSSVDWQMKFTIPEERCEDLPTKICSAVVDASAIQSEASIDSLQETLSSSDWVACSTLGPHVDVSINHEMLTTSDVELSPRSDVPSSLYPPKTDWDNVFFSQLQLVPSQLVYCASASNKAVASDEITICDHETVPALELEEATAELVASCTHSSEDSSQTQVSQIEKKKRVRKPRQKVVPEEKKYVTPLKNDVLLGRGGRSNHHEGNKRYREEVKNLRSWYLSIGENKEEKTALSQCLVDYVHGYQGRFLEKDKTGWYVVPNIVARRKASQALREDDDPEKRAAKRARFLQRKNAETQST